MGVNMELIIAGGVNNCKEAEEIEDIVKVSMLAQRIRELSHLQLF